MRSGHRSVTLLALVMVLTAVAPGVSEERPRLVITAQELIQRDHRLTVAAGTEILWQDPHFGRVWFPAATDAPRVDRAEVGFRAVFLKPGTFRGRFTIVGGIEAMTFTR